ncbi:discoidin domain-containing protein [Cohnella soli]|uniref:Discoidin domain-containing protein n=1 Tax=Cohnella soli TaxID=425005 RepID=A0ABW0HP65_9BACL
MKKVLLLLLSLVFVFSMFFVSPIPGSEPTVSADPLNQLNVWSPPSGTPANTKFTVQVRESGQSQWTDLFEYNVKVGHQNVAKVDSSMVNFDFAGTVDVKVTYNGGTVNSYVIGPESYGIQSSRSGNTITFSMTQNNDAPRNAVVRINGDWEQDVLHIVTNPPEQNPVDPNASNVYVVQPGAEVPLQLPAGKDTYYFALGNHTLTPGLWVEVDLGASYPVSSIGLNQGKSLSGGASAPVTPQKFIVETKASAGASYTTAYDGTGNSQTGNITRNFTEVQARYVRLRLLGNNGTARDIFSSFVSEFAVYATGSSTNLALNHATAGAMPGYAKAVDGSSTTQYDSTSEYGNWHAGETFFLSKSNYTAYIAAGAIVHGSIMSDGLSNVTVRGRGILDGSQLTHLPETLAESRVGAIWLIGGSDHLVEGITITDFPMWNVVMNFTDRPIARNIHIFGSNINADGIHMSASKDGSITGVFIRTCDDHIVMYHYGPTSGIAVRNSVFWGDDAHIILLGLGEKSNSDITNMTFENLDVLTQQGVYIVDKFTGVMKLWASSGNSIKNILFKDIRVEAFRSPEKSKVFHFRTDQLSPGVGKGKSVEDVVLDNVTYNGSGEQPSLLYGVDANSYIKNIYIRNYKRQGVLAHDAASANLTADSQVSNVFFENTQWDDRFDGQITGAAPTGWSSTSGVTVQAAPGGATGSSVRVQKTGTQAVVTGRALAPAIDGDVAVQAKMYMTDKTNWKSIIVENSSGQTLLQVGFDSGGNIFSNQGTVYSARMAYNTNQWYAVKAVVHTLTDTYDLYVDGTQILTGAALETATSNVGQVKFGSAETAAGTYYFDDVSVAKVTEAVFGTGTPGVLVDESFDSAVTGNSPAGWSIVKGASSSVTVQNVPSGTDKSVRVLKSGTDPVIAMKPFEPTAGRLTIEAKINISDKTNWKSLIINNGIDQELLQVGFDSGGNIYRNNGTSFSTLMTYDTDRWYAIKVVIDTATDKYDLYIDGSLKAAGYALEAATDNVGIVKFGSAEAANGTFYFDQVKVTIGGTLASQLIDDNFESDTVGNAPGNWSASSGITVVQQSGGSNKYVRVLKSSSSAIVAGKSFASQSGKVTVSADMRFADKNNWKSMIVEDSGGQTLVQIGFDSGGHIYCNNGSSYSYFTSYNTNQWYAVKVIVDTVADTYELYIDGVRQLNGNALVNATANVSQVKFGSAETPSGSYDFDNVKVTAS